jgi:hypothetical protein
MPGHSKSRAGIAPRTGGPPGGVRRGNGAGHGGPAKGAGKGPARGYTWEQATEGNELSVVHGAATEKVYTPIAEVITTDLLTDVTCPDYLKAPVMRYAIRGWAVAEAKCLLVEEWLESLSTEEQFVARKQGQSAPMEIWVKLEKHAANMRARLGLDPVSKVRIGKALTSTGLDLAQLAAKYGEQLDGDGDD